MLIYHGNLRFIKTETKFDLICLKSRSRNTLKSFTEAFIWLHNFETVTSSNDIFCDGVNDHHSKFYFIFIILSWSLKEVHEFEAIIQLSPICAYFYEL